MGGSATNCPWTWLRTSPVMTQPTATGSQEPHGGGERWGEPPLTPALQRAATPTVCGGSESLCVTRVGVGPGSSPQHGLAVPDGCTRTRVKTGRHRPGGRAPCSPAPGSLPPVSAPTPLRASGPCASVFPPRTSPRGGPSHRTPGDSAVPSSRLQCSGHFCTWPHGGNRNLGSWGAASSLPLPLPRSRCHTGPRARRNRAADQNQLFVVSILTRRL